MKKLLFFATIIFVVLLFCFCDKSCKHDFGDLIILEEANCVNSGMGIRICSLCNYSESVIIPSNSNHTVVIDYGKEATCTSSGLTDGAHCELCGEIISKQEVIPQKEHNIITVAEVPATCTHEGHSEGKKCSVCGTVFVESIVIPQKAHTVIVTSGYKATCSKEGLTDGKKCSVCGLIIAEQTTIPKISHSYVNYKCTSCGKIDPNNYYEYMVYWLKKNGTYKSGAYSIGTDSYYGNHSMYCDVFYSQSDGLCFRCAIAIDSTASIMTYLYINENLKGNYNWVGAIGNGSSQSVNANGYLTAKSFTSSSSITVSYISYNSSNMVEMFNECIRCSIANAKSLLSNKKAGITIGNLGFSNYK